MRTALLPAIILFISGCAAHRVRKPLENTEGIPCYDYSLDLSKISNDKLAVTPAAASLSGENNILNNAETIPGSTIPDVRRFVTSFKAFDDNGNELSFKKEWLFMIQTPRKKEMGFMEDDTLPVCNSIDATYKNIDELINRLKLRTEESWLFYTAKIKLGHEMMDIQSKTRYCALAISSGL